MSSAATGVLDEAYQRLHQTGPEYESWLSNHGPMAAEAMARHGHGAEVGRWLDGYVRGLEEFPRGSGPVGADWREALGDPKRIADWTVFFQREVTGQPWRQVLGGWWPRLLPGSAASATHGIIRVGHAVRALLADGDDPVHVAELAHGLAYWAARWQPYPRADGQPAPAPGLTPAAALAVVPRLADQLSRAGSVTASRCWPSCRPVPARRWPKVRREKSGAWLYGLSDAAVLRYPDIAHGDPVMLVHSATAPTVILRSLPALDAGLWAPSAAAVWEAAAALTAIYARSGPASPGQGTAVRHGVGAIDEVFGPGGRARRRARDQVRRHPGRRARAHG